MGLGNLNKECVTLKAKVDEQDNLIKDSKKKKDELEKKNIESEHKQKEMVKAHDTEALGLKKMIESITAELKTAQSSASKASDSQSLKMEVESLTKVLVETKQESVTFKSKWKLKTKNFHLQKNKLKISKSLPMIPVM